MDSFHVRLQYKDNEPGYLDWPPGAPIPQVGDGFVFGGEDQPRHCVIDTNWVYAIDDSGRVTVEVHLLLDDEDFEDDE